MSLEEQVQGLQDLVIHLGQQVAELREENRCLREENRRLRKENESLRQDNELLQQEIEQLSEGKAGRPPSFVKAKRPKGDRGRRKKRAAKDNHGRRRMAPTRYENHEIEVCPECGERLTQGTCCYRREVIDIPPPQAVEVVEHQVMKGWCWRCRCWRSAAVDWTGVVVGNGRVGVRLMGLVAYMRARLRVPLRTIQEYVQTAYQLHLSVGEISDLCRRTVGQLAQGSAGLLAEARASPVLHMDETGWREDGQNGYIWCLVTDTPQAVRYYEFHRSRGGAVAKTMLGTFSGHLVTDFYSAYNQYSGRHQRCWVHLLRDLQTLQEAHEDHGEVVAWASGVKRLYYYATEQLATGLTAEERQQLSERLRQMTSQFGLPYAMVSDHPCRTLAKRLLRHQNELFQFVSHPLVPADNNLAERALRPLVVQRKISGGSRSEVGSKTRMQLASLFETWQARKLNPLLECWRQLGYEPTLATA